MQQAAALSVLRHPGAEHQRLCQLGIMPQSVRLTIGGIGAPLLVPERGSGLRKLRIAAMVDSRFFRFSDAHAKAGRRLQRQQ